MNKNIMKSKKIVENALSVFSSAIVNIDKANAILVKSLEDEKEAFDNATSQIKHLEQQLDVISSNMVLIQAEIAKNDELKDSLTSFMHGGNK